MPAFNPTFGESPQRTLFEFVAYFEGVMDEISGLRPFGDFLPDALPRPIVSEELIGRLFEAWASAKGRLAELRRRLDAIAREALEDHGLVGPELDFKMASVAHASRQLFDRPIVRFLRKLLSVIDPALQSILDSVGLGGALAEIKETVEAGIEDET